jgi:WG containing repeat
MISTRFLTITMAWCCLSLIARGQTDSLYPYYTGKKWGLTNQHLTILAAPQYDTVGNFEDPADRFTFVLQNGKYAHINRQGKLLYTPQYDSLGPVYGPLVYCAAKKGRKWGFIELPSGKIACPLTYDRVDFYTYGADLSFATVYMGGKMGLVNLRTKKQLCPAEYDEKSGFSDILFTMRRGNKWALVHKEKGLLTQPLYDQISYNNGIELIEAKLKDTKHYFDQHGKRVQHTKRVKPPAPDDQMNIIEEKMNVGMEEPPIATVEGEPGRGYQARVYNTGPQSWKLAIERQKSGYGSPVEILKTFELNGYDELTVMRYMWGAKIEDALIYLKARKAGKWGLIDHTEKQAIPFEYDNLQNEYRYIKVVKNGLTGIFSPEFRQVYPAQFSYFNEYRGYVYRVDLADGRKGYAGANGKLYIPQQ